MFVRIVPVHSPSVARPTAPSPSYAPPLTSYATLPLPADQPGTDETRCLLLNGNKTAKKNTAIKKTHTHTHRYDSLKADLSVSLEETRGGADAAAFGAPSKSGGDRPWGGSGAGGPTTIADVIAAAASAGGSLSPGGEERAGEGQYLWGCTSPQEELQQLVSFVSLGCFDPSARLQARTYSL